ncbi:MAG: hypothetical protein WD638_06160 [Nitriliruptoraceae bacterium]
MDSPDDPPTDRSPGADERPRVRPVDLRDYADFRHGEASRIRVFASPSLALDLWCIEPGSATGVLHLADADVAYAVIGGRGWFVTDDGEVGLDPLGALLVPADTVHGIDNRLPDPLIVLAAVAPPGGQDEDPVTDDPEAIAAAVSWGAGDRPGVLRRAIEAVLGVRGTR